MSQIVRMPDGTKVSFPDDMPKEEIRALIEDKFPDAARQAADPKAVMFDKFADKAQDLKANQAPYIEGAVKGLDAGGGLSPQEEAAGWERGTLLPIAKNPATGERKMAVPGVVMGAYDAFKLPGDVYSGKVDMDPAKPVSDEAVARSVGFTTMFSPGVPKGAPKPLPGNTLAIVPKAAKGMAEGGIPTAADIKAVSQAAYSQAKGSQIAADATPGLVNALRTVLDKEGLVRPDGKLASTFSQVRTAMKDADAYSGKPMTFEQFQRLEEALQSVAGSKTPGESRIGKMLLDEFDKYFEALPDTAFAKGTGATVKSGYSTGKQNWALFKKLSQVEKAISNAEIAKGGFSSESLRNEFRTILKSDRKSLGFSPGELQMMRQFVMGGKIDKISDWLSGLRGVLFGGVAGGMIGAGATMIGGAAVKGLTAGGAKKTANQLRLSIAAGAGKPAGNTLSLPSTSATGGPAVLSGVRALGAGSENEAERGGLLRSLRLSAAGQ